MIVKPALIFLLVTWPSLASAADRYVGQTLFPDPKHKFQICDAPIDYSKPLPRCHIPKPNGPIKILSETMQSTRYVTMKNGYEVQESDGKIGYVRTTDPIFMLTQDDKKKAAAAATECNRKGGVSVGMTASQVFSSCWGKPRRVNTTITARGKHEQWVYGGGYLYLDDGVVTSIQTSD